MSNTIFTENELKKLKDYFDWQSEAQDDILESEMWDEKVEWDDDICKKSVIIWSMVRYSENDDDDEEETKYKVKVEFRRYKDENTNCGDTLINSFDLSLGEAIEDLDKLNKAINCFIENGGKREDFKRWYSE